MKSRQLSKAPVHITRQTALGFTLMEMAVVITLMAIFLTMGLRMLRATQESAAWSETRAKQERIKVALIAFLRTNGRLPCPDSALPPTGGEPVACLVNAGRGVLPWKVLGLSVGDVQDGWANFFTYRVANRTPASASNWTIKAGLPAAAPFTIAELATPLTAFTLQERNDVGVLGAALSPNPVVVIISHGKNGSGARTVRGTAVIPLPTGADELANAGAASTTFVRRTPTDVAGATGGTFDDLVAYMTPGDLLQPLVDDKTLKGGTPAYYREQAVQQAALAMTPCTPQSVAPVLTSIQPGIGNGTVTYSCPGAAYACFAPGTPVTSATLGAKQLYQLSMFGAAAADVTYSNLFAAYPGIVTRCP
jgi:type II secretory pathway pseudopilin PulG